MLCSEVYLSNFQMVTMWKLSSIYLKSILTISMIKLCFKIIFNIISSMFRSKPSIFNLSCLFNLFSIHLFALFLPFQLFRYILIFNFSVNIVFVFTLSLYIFQCFFFLEIATLNFDNLVWSIFCHLMWNVKISTIWVL